MNDFEDFIGDVLAAAPAVGEEMSRADVPLQPDIEISVSWVGDVGHAIVAAFDALSPAERQGVFGAVERHLSSGSELLRTSIATGLLEVLSEATNRHRLDGPTLAALLGPGSRAYIDAWDQFSLGRSTLDPS